MSVGERLPMASTVNVSVTALDVTPNDCPLADPMNITVRATRAPRAPLGPRASCRLPPRARALTRARGGPRPRQMEFTTDGAVEGGVWEVKYMVDMTSKRQIVEVRRAGPSPRPDVASCTAHAAPGPATRESSRSLQPPPARPGAPLRLAPPVGASSSPAAPQVGSTEAVDYGAGPASMRFSAPGMDLGQVKPRRAARPSLRCARRGCSNATGAPTPTPASADC